MNDEHLDRVEELLCDRALWGCDDEDLAELRREFVKDPAIRREGDALVLTAAAVAAALAAKSSEAPPPALRARLDRMAVGFLMERHNLSLQDITAALEARAEPQAPRPPAPILGGPWLSHAVAVAALLVAAVLFFTRERGLSVMPIDQQRAALVHTAPDLVRLDWKGQGVGGDVCWSDERQQGFMTFRGLQRNDPSEFQYQLWIFDRGRKDTAERPVDGGVFNANAKGEIVVPIRTNIVVHQAFAFAVTRERPGGVVVSAKDQIVTSAGL